MLKFISVLFFTIHIVIVFHPRPIQAQSHSELAEKLLARGDIQLAQGNLKDAKRFYKAALKNDKDLLAAYRNLGKISMKEDDWDNAGDQFDKILDRDPDNFEAHYYRAICHREMGKFKPRFLHQIPLVRKLLDFDKAQKHFDWIVSRDSLYQDVLYQYAKLQRYREKYTEAIELGQDQIRLRPELNESQRGLLRLYKYFIEHKDEHEVLAWLSRKPWDHARYFSGEKLRLDGKLEQADSVFLELLGRPLTLRRQPIYLSLTKVYYKQNMPELAEEYFWRAVDEIESDLDADLVFEDVKYIVTDQELETYRELASIPEKIAFFHRLWVSRDPTPAAERNVRLAEHYRRFLYSEEHYAYDGFRFWANSPDKLSYLKGHFPRAYRLNHEFNDKGLIYIRHGPPEETQVTINQNVPPNESWRYFEIEGRAEMIFHFLIDANATGNDWRFAPVITDSTMVIDRAHWGRIYQRLMNPSTSEQLYLQDEMAKESQHSVELGLTTDRHTWGKELNSIYVPYAMATFRGDGGRTLVEVYYGLSLSMLKQAMDDTAGELQIERGISVHDLNWRPVVNQLGTVSIARPKNNSDIYIDLFNFAVPPDSYSVALHSRPLNTNLLGGSKFEKRIDDFSVSGLTMSDIELAHLIEPATAENKFVKNGLLVLPNPAGGYATNTPVYLYFEIYQLTPDSAGRTSYSIEYTLTPLNRKKSIKNFFGLFGGSKPPISIRTNREGFSESSVEHLAIDVRELSPGGYTLSVKVTDERSEDSSERSSKIVLY